MFELFSIFAEGRDEKARSESPPSSAATIEHLKQIDVHTALEGAPIFKKEI
jgi:hypothetical protein